MPEPGLRERKKQRTRRTLIESAYELFEQEGYEATTVARIAEAAEVSVATFFNYFASKDDVLFPDTGDVLTAGLDAIAARAADDGPIDVLDRAIHAMIDSTRSGSRDPAGRLETRRLRLIMSTPQLRARMLDHAFTALRRLAGALHHAYPDDFDEADATVLVGGVFGAGLAAASVAVEHDQPSDRTLTRSVDLITTALRNLPPSGRWRAAQEGER
ncbi:TetR/AcrR family transcriptional regulator [Streptomonospora sp. PA3]|uniref:TetR/AcrR family transcriptional regulator n=1 Tax=Streptomonospora sp. PA3 TaxID=2607326 RepID=UPI0012DED372|nr:TetR/AcrR family transcriptional regulator [Streptomonospora sp. PA3]MUL41497.1 TetR/AcrR family transcriptional regulator [Streptomonospora sp. PA3]